MIAINFIGCYVVAIRAVVIPHRTGATKRITHDPDNAPAPCRGGGVERGSSLPANLIREVYEETGLHITVDAPCLVNEFHDPDGHFHQVDVYFHCTLRGTPTLDHGWEDIDAIVTDRRWVTRTQMTDLRVKPDSLAAVAWRDADAPMYDPLEPLIV